MAFGQAGAPNPGKPPLAFEVATIKPHQSGTSCDDEIGQSGRVSIRCVTLKGLIYTAYGVPWFAIRGGDEEWATKRFYDIDARVPEDFPVEKLNTTRSNIRLADPYVHEMLQTLLAERFHLQSHRESKPGTIYALVRTGKPTPLVPAKELPKPDPSRPQDAPFAGEVEHVGGGWFLINESMADLAKFASVYQIHKPVVDETGMAGMYNYQTPESQRDPSEQAVGQNEEDGFKRMLGVLGLKLEPRPGQIETFVIDHAEPPTAN